METQYREQPVIVYDQARDRYSRPKAFARSSAVSRPMYIIQTPKSGSSSYTLDQTSSIEIEIPPRGNLPPTFLNDMYLEFSLTVAETASTKVWVEPYGVVQRIDHEVNGLHPTKNPNRRDKLASIRLADSCYQQNYTLGSMVGFAHNWGSYPVLSSLSTSNPAYFDVGSGSVTKYFSIPFRILADGLLADCDSVVNLQYITGVNKITLTLNTPRTCAWANNASAAVTPPTITMSNIQLAIPIVNIANDTVVYNAMRGSGIIYTTLTEEQQTTSSLTLGNGGNRSNADIAVNGLPKSVRYVQVVFEGQTQATHIGSAYKCLTMPSCGIETYQFNFDGKMIPDRPVRCRSTQAAGGATPIEVEGYRNFLEITNAIRKTRKEWMNTSGGSVNLNSFTESRYLSADPDATGDANVQKISLWRALCDLTSADRDAFGGSTYSQLSVSLQYSGTAGFYDGGGDGSVNDAMTVFNMILFYMTNFACAIGTTSGEQVVIQA